MREHTMYVKDAPAVQDPRGLVDNAGLPEIELSDDDLEQVVGGLARPWTDGGEWLIDPAVRPL
jgi:hypothetical protein